MSHEANSSEIYGKYPREKVFEVVKAAPWLRDQQFTSADMPTLHKQVAAIQRERPLNLVIVLEESLVRPSSNRWAACRLRRNWKTEEGRLVV
jgi:hypothetical protein